MGEAQSAVNGRKYIPYLEGIRGFGFLSVFFVHYFAPYQMAHKGTSAFRFWVATETISYCAVPVFFLLSGYLIGGILFETRNREGFFRVFYTRRVVRVFPVYYLTLLVTAALVTYKGLHLDYHFWSHFLFIHNLFPDYVNYRSAAPMLHFWSLAVEEQFYLLWPLAVWIFPERRKLIGLAGFFILAIFGIRYAAPFIFTTANQIRYLSLTRGDPILMGVVLALIKHKPIFEQIKRFAKWFVLPGIIVPFAWAFWKDDSWPQSFHGAQIMIPWVNFTAFALVMAVMEETSWISRACSQHWICWFGRRSYSLYVFHFLYIGWFFEKVTPYLANYVPHMAAFLISNALALSLTVLLATLSYHLIEKPTQKIKQRVKYGPVRETRWSRRREEVLVNTSA